jgi:hypothetical protein
MIIKQLPKDPFSRFFVTEGQFDLREIKFYTQVSDKNRDFFLFEIFNKFLIAFACVAVSGDTRLERVQQEENIVV